MQLMSRAKHSSTAMAHKEVCPRDEIANPPGTNVLLIDRHGFAEGFESFRTLCGVQSSLARFAPNRAIVWGPPRWSGSHYKRLYVSGLRPPELSTQVKLSYII